MDERRRDDWRGEIQDHQAFLRRLARGLAADEHRAEDLVQDAWVAALRQPPAAPGAVRAWFGRVVRNASITRSLRGDRRARREERAARPEAVAGPDEMEERLELERLVVEAVQSLPEPHRRTIYLRYYEDLGPAAIATQVGAPLTTVRSRLARGRELLREKLDRHFDGGRSAWSAVLLALADGPGKNVVPAVPVSLTPKLVGTLLMAAKTTLLVIAAGAAAIALLVWHPWDARPGADTRASENTALATVALPPTDDATDEAHSPLIVPEDAEVATREPVGQPSLLPPADPELAALEVEVRYESDGAPGVGRRGYLWRDGDSEFGGLLVCDEAGRARLDGVTPGRWMVRVIGAWYVPVTLESGETTGIEVEIPPGILLRGLIVGPDDEPVPHAFLYRAGHEGPLERALLTRSDERGRFEVRDAPSGSFIAGAPGYACSYECSTHALVGQTVDVVLRLPGPSGAIRGRVLDGHDEPVPRARVVVLQEYGEGFVSDEGFTMSEPSPIDIRADEDGRFQIPDVHTGRTEVQAGSPGHVLTKKTLDVRPGEEHEVELVLGSGGALRGTVCDASGTPIQWAKIEVDLGGDWWKEDLHKLLTREASTDEAGEFFLAGLPGMDVVVKVSHWTEGSTSKELKILDGEEVRWDAVLAPCREVRGRVVDEDGKPLPDMVVETTTTDLLYLGHPSTRTDDEGRFHLLDCPPDHEVLTVGQDWIPGGRYHVMMDLPPTDEDLEVVVPRDRLPSAFVEARIVDEAGESIEGSTMGASLEEGRDRMGLGVRPDPTTNVARHGPLRAGRYRIFISAPGHLAAPYETVELSSGQILDMGTYRLVRGGLLEASIVTGDDWSTTGPPQFHLRDSAGKHRSLVDLENDTARSRILTPGSYTVVVFGGGVAYTECPVEVRAGETARAKFAVERGASRLVRIASPLDLSRDRVTIEVRDEEGHLVPFGEETLWRQAPNLYRVMGLTKGRYKLVARTRFGLGGTTPFAIESLDPSDEVIVVGVR